MSKNQSKRVIVFDTTLRDGEQAPGFHMDGKEKLKVAWQLHRLGVDVVEAGFPASSVADAAAVRRIAGTVGRAPGAPEIAGLARCVDRDVDVTWEAVRPARHPRIHVFLGTSDLHLKFKFRITREEALQRAVAAVRRARGYCRNVEFSAEDASRTSLAYLSAVIEAVIDAGATTVNIPDTTGYALPHEFGQFVGSVIKRVKNANRAVFSVHCQNDLGMATANSVAGLVAGARQIECTINGIGERAGNTSLEEIVMALKVRETALGLTTGIDTREIYPASRLVAEITGVDVQPNKAIVGANAFAHASGIHQDGYLKNPATYEIMKPQEVGSPGSTLPLTARSGRAALAARLKTMGYSMDEAKVAAIFPAFKKIAENCRVVGDAELKGLMR